MVLSSSCSTSGPVTFNSPYIGKSYSQLINNKGNPQKIKNFGNQKAYIYITKEEYFGNNKNLEKNKPKSSVQIEYIYYVDPQGIIYKYQVWKKKLKK